jgi:hypothetical protein
MEVLMFGIVSDRTNYYRTFIMHTMFNECGSNSELRPSLNIEPHELRVDLSAAHVTDPSHSRVEN